MTDDAHHTHSISTASIAGWLVLLIAIAGGTWLLRQDILATTRNGNPSEPVLVELKAQGETLAALKVELNMLRQSPPAATDTVTPILNDVTTQLATIAQRLEALEAVAKAPTPPPPSSPAPAASVAPARLLMSLSRKFARGAPYHEELEPLVVLPQVVNEVEAIASLRALAMQGAPTDLTLRGQLDNILVRPSSAPADTQPAAGTQSHLNGLITIKRRAAVASSSPSPLQFAPDTPIATIAETIAALPEDARTPFAEWLAAVAARDKAQQALTTLQNKLLPIQ